MMDQQDLMKETKHPHQLFTAPQSRPAEKASIFDIQSSVNNQVHRTSSMKNNSVRSSIEKLKSSIEKHSSGMM